jgi:hypothetical protein
MKWVLLVMFINSNSVSYMESAYFSSEKSCLTALTWVKDEYMRSGGRIPIKAECFKE